MDGLAKQYQEEDEFLWYLTECFTASRKKGKVVVKKTRPHSVIQVGAIGSFITSRNRYASGDLGLPLGLWLFACQAHTTSSASSAALAIAVKPERPEGKGPHAIDRGEAEWGKRSQSIASNQLQALSTNAEQQIQNKGYQAGFFDFDEQMGIEPDKCDNILSWNRGDGATHAALKRIKLIQATIPSIYCSFRNALSTPETWHTKATDLNSCASNHYGPSASPDPSSLSHSSNAANMKRPSDLKKCDFYPTSRSMTLIWEACVLDCWRSVFSIVFTQPDADVDMPGLHNISDDNEDPSIETPAVADPKAARPESAADEDGPKMHKEPPGFNGDRVLSNTILFLVEFGWWVELNYAIPEGDVGRVLEIFKIFVFTFAGSSNQNYLDLYALLEFECSPDLKEALLNNYLFNLRGEIGTFVEGDLMQEWSNRWLQDFSGRGGGDFDDNFYRKTISPNVLHFLKMKENIETAFELKRRSKAHTSPHLRDETKVLLHLYQDEELHCFRSGRSIGHAAVNRFDRGYQWLEDGKMAEYLERSKEYADVVEEMEILRNGGPQRHKAELGIRRQKSTTAEPAQAFLENRG
ncbi:hypothetical protein B0H17DRAFT_1219140 [Mycena rosella]|uniref:DUF6589 domain-containing protein n=1 Tax=Mycena rosella TaxID=1033263 RepID=A0AAD7FGJ8_MYCRO|nr:hypothetical protein B0H17DRAFT_1219140 [Mycena rosella]